MDCWRCWYLECNEMLSVAIFSFIEHLTTVEAHCLQTNYHFICSLITTNDKHYWLLLPLSTSSSSMLHACFRIESVALTSFCGFYCWHPSEDCQKWNPDKIAEIFVLQFTTSWVCQISSNLKYFPVSNIFERLEQAGVMVVGGV